MVPLRPGVATQNPIQKGNPGSRPAALDGRADPGGVPLFLIPS
jgi:hypothetical protein